MKKLLILPALLLALASCKKDQDPNTTITTTEEITKVDTAGPKLRTTTVISETKKTDSTETTITTGGVKMEPNTPEGEKK
jgi:ABC-type uncharacterized transport system auxiliary subunit